MVKVELDVEDISWYIGTALGIDTVPAMDDTIIVDRGCISARDRAKLWKTPSNQVFKWADEEKDISVMEWFDNNTKMLADRRAWEYDVEEEETMCIFSVKFVRYEGL